MTKLDTTKIFMKYGNEGKFRDVSEITINNMTLEERLARMEDVEARFHDLIRHLQGHYIVKEDSDYIIEIDGKLYKSKLNVYKVEDTKLPLSFYKVENGKIVVNKKKVGAL